MFPTEKPLPAALQDATVTVTSVEPLTAVLTLLSDDGEHHVLIDRFKAAQLAAALIDLLSVDPSDPRVQNDASTN